MALVDTIQPEWPAEGRLKGRVVNIRELAESVDAGKLTMDDVAVLQVWLPGEQDPIRPWKEVYLEPWEDCMAGFDGPADDDAFMQEAELPGGMTDEKLEALRAEAFGPQPEDMPVLGVFKGSGYRINRWRRMVWVAVMRHHMGPPKEE